MADDAPIALRLAAQKPRMLAGEGIVLDLALEVRTEVEMETVEINRGRTEVLVSALGGSEYGNRGLTGEDYMVLPRHPPPGAGSYPLRRARRKRLDGPTGTVPVLAAAARGALPHRGDLPLGNR